MSRIVAPSDRLLAEALEAPHGVRRLAAALVAAGVEVVAVGADRFGPVAAAGPRVDPSVLALELGRAAPGIGVLIAIAPTRDHPYNTARRILSVDHLLDGRAGVLIGGPDLGTAPSEAGTVWTTEPEDDRLVAEYAGVLRGLWTTWPAESIIADRASGRFADPGVIRRLDHDGSWRIGGALTTPSSPQGEPVIAVLPGHGDVPDADLVVAPEGSGGDGAFALVRVDDLEALAADPGTAGGDPDPARPSRTTTGPAPTLRALLGIAERRLDRSTAAPAFATETGGLR